MGPIIFPVINLKSIFPELMVVITALVVLLCDLSLSKEKKAPLPFLHIRFSFLSYLFYLHVERRCSRVCFQQYDRN